MENYNCEPQEGMSLTENGALALASTGSDLLDLDQRLVRSFIKTNNVMQPSENLITLFRAAFTTNKMAFLCWLLELRDRDAKGERELSFMVLRWLYREENKIFMKFYPIFIDLGRWKDCIEARIHHFDNDGTVNDAILLDFFADKLREDALEDITNSLAAKWAPREGTKYDKEARYLASRLYSETGKKKRMMHYRKMIVSCSSTVEQSLTDKDYKEIDPGKVPAGALYKYGKKTIKIHRSVENQEGAFYRHLRERYENWLADVKSGKKEIKTTGIQPDKLVRPYLNYSPEDPMLEEMFKKMKEDAEISGDFAAVCDVSGSMTGEPMEVAIALSLFAKFVITFSEEPEEFEIPEGSLYNKVKALKGMRAGFSTNVLSVFRLILSHAKKYRLTQEQLPKALFIFTDMQFNENRNLQNNGRNSKMPEEGTIYQTVRKEFTEAGYRLPVLIFWNLRNSSNVAHPVKSTEHGTVLVSGYSQKMIPIIMKTMDSFPDITAEDVLRERLVKYLDRVRPIFQ